MITHVLGIDHKTKKISWISPFERIKKQRRNTESYLRKNEARNIERPITKIDIVLNGTSSSFMDGIIHKRHTPSVNKEFTKTAYEMFKRKCTVTPAPKLFKFPSKQRIVPKRKHTSKRRVAQLGMYCIYAYKL